MKNNEYLKYKKIIGKVHSNCPNTLYIEVTKAEAIFALRRDAEAKFLVLAL